MFREMQKPDAVENPDHPDAESVSIPERLKPGYFRDQTKLFVLTCIIAGIVFFGATYWAQANLHWFNKDNPLVFGAMVGIILSLSWRSSKAMSKMVYRLMGAREIV